MLWTRRTLGVMVPLVAGIALAWLVGVDVMGSNGVFIPLAVIGTDALAGILVGFLLRSWWAVALAPVALAFGVAAFSLIRAGTIAQGAIEEVVPLAIIVLAVLLLPTALGAAIGTAVGRRSATHTSA